MLDNERWLDFWFQPYLYLHSSWMQDLDQRLLTEQSSSLAWHVSYPYVCNVYGIPIHYQNMSEGLINNVIFDLLSGDKSVLDMACIMLGGSSKSEAIPTILKRTLLQRSRALSLKKRLYEPTNNISEDDCGLLLTYLFCSFIDVHYWQRIRLSFEKERVVAIENNSQSVALSASNQKAIQRAWNEIYQLRHQEKSNADVNMDDRISVDKVSRLHDDELSDADIDAAIQFAIAR